MELWKHWYQSLCQYVPVSKLAEVLKIHIFQKLRQSRQLSGTALYHIIMHGIVADKREE